MLSKYLINHDKAYEVVLKLGEKTDTADSEGEVIVEKEVAINTLEEKNIKKALEKFIGKQKQIPPMYSAIKVNGKKLYEYAREGKKIEVAPRKIEIYNIDILNINKEKEELVFIVSCSKGTYIRTLCEDIAKHLNTVGYMKELNRIQVGRFNLEDSITIEELQESCNNQSFMDKHFISIEEFFADKPNIILQDKMLKQFLNGVKLQYNFNDGIYKIYSNKKIFVGTGVVEGKVLKRDIIL